MSEAKDVDGVQIIQKAIVPDKKEKPKRIKIVFSTTLVACLIAIIYALLREAGTQMSKEDLERLNRIRLMFRFKNQ